MDLVCWIFAQTFPLPPSAPIVCFLSPTIVPWTVTWLSPSAYSLASNLHRCSLKAITDYMSICWRCSDALRSVIMSFFRLAGHDRLSRHCGQEGELFVPDWPSLCIMLSPIAAGAQLMPDPGCA